ncbi:hypothetical protein F6V25_03250 [Oryzomonas japonica]|uniref:Uncharacterized protein n=1 Tax=Oryzomonas japonica TaxID=2603858 RepID=A0A7J4ZVT8_9BACT|nr:hypothetical protein [Oryzomonas japonica]KAB0667728.1 hypothetical protein F6V25_03250 [Oryzomonas japonica]
MNQLPNKKNETPCTPQREPSREFIEVDITIHIFTVSATLVGACLTVLGIFIMSRRLSHVKSFGEELLVCDAFMFLVSCILSYSALRIRRIGRRHRLEQLAEEVFFIALAFMVFICGFIIYELR